MSSQSSQRLQEYITEWFTRMARRVNNSPALLQGMEQARGRSILVILSDLDKGSGLLLDANGLVTVVDPGAVNPSMTVETAFRTFMDIMDGKVDLDQAFYFSYVNVYGARFLADYLMVKEFFERLRAASNVAS